MLVPYLPHSKELSYENNKPTYFLTMLIVRETFDTTPGRPDGGESSASVVTVLWLFKLGWGGKGSQQQ